MTSATASRFFEIPSAVLKGPIRPA
jgi:hypothetical protein